MTALITKDQSEMKKNNNNKTKTELKFREFYLVDMPASFQLSKFDSTDSTYTRPRQQQLCLLKFPLTCAARLGWVWLVGWMTIRNKTKLCPPNKAPSILGEGLLLQHAINVSKRPCQVSKSVHLYQVSLIPGAFF